MAIQVEGGVIKDELKCKLLGYIYSSDGTQVANFNNTLRKGWNHLHKLRKLSSFAPPHIRGILAHAHIMSHISYSAFLFASLPEYCFDKLHKLINTAARWARGNYGYKVRVSDILNEFKLLDEHRLINLAAFKITCNMVNTGSPQPV